MGAAASRARLRRLLDAWAEAVRRRDLEGVLAHHAADMILYDVVPPLRSIGLEAYRRSWADQFFPWFHVDGRFELRDVVLVAGEDVGFACALIDCAGMEHARPVSYTVRLTMGFERRDGHWTIVHEHHSEPLGDADAGSA
jgi:ketosteroid isomerase-like protein